MHSFNATLFNVNMDDKQFFKNIFLLPSELAQDESDVVVNVCVSQPCLNGAACINDDGGYLCLCEAGFTGEQCETGW